MLSGHTPPHAHPGEPALWERVFANYWFFADRFGWTPSQVDDQSSVILDRLREVTLTIEEWRVEKAERDG